MAKKNKEKNGNGAPVDRAPQKHNWKGAKVIAVRDGCVDVEFADGSEATVTPEQAASIK